MVSRKAPALTVRIVLNFDERRRMAMFISLLIAIDKRVCGHKKAIKKPRPVKKARICCGPSTLSITILFLCSACAKASADKQYNQHIIIVTIMIDTIVFTLNKSMFHISEPNQFAPSSVAKAMADKPAHYVLQNNGVQSKQNPTKKELQNGIYKPRLTLFKRPNLYGVPEIILKIELSLPKLFFGNNFEEFQYKDFAPLVQKLAATLAVMGVIVSPDTLACAPLSAIHYSKNILLTDGSTPYHYINKIKEANIKLSLDVNQTDYRNDGHSYKWHCNAYEVVFYDKIKDLEMGKKSSKRTLEKDNAIQLHIFNKLQKRKNWEVLRMEVRLNKRQKMKSLFKKLGIKSDLTLKKLFKPAISKKILLHYLDELESKRPSLLDFKAANDKALLIALIENNPTLNPKCLIQAFGLKKALEVMSIRELRGIFATYHKRGWYRLIKEANEIKLPIPQRPLGTLRRYIEKFKPARLSNNIKQVFKGSFHEFSYCQKP